MSIKMADSTRRCGLCGHALLSSWTPMYCYPCGEVVKKRGREHGYKLLVARKRPGLSLKMKLAILRRDLYECQVCGISRIDYPTVELEIDHKVPVSKGGSNAAYNLWVLCKACNRLKSDRDLEEWQGASNT